MTVIEYPFSNIDGKGKLDRDVDFAIINLSADRLRIKTDATIELISKVSLDMALDCGIGQLKIKGNGIVSRKINNGYEVRFTGMSEADKTEINDIVKKQLHC